MSKIVVDVISPNPLCSGIGPMGTLKRILKNREFFLEQKLDITIFAHDVLGGINSIGEVPDARTINSSGLLKNLKGLGKDLLKKSFFLSKCFIEKRHREEEYIVNQYMSLERDPDVIVFHDSYTCAYYLKVRRTATAKVVVFYHSDVIPQKMNEYYYPLLKGSRYMENLKEQDKFVAYNADQNVFITRVGLENFNYLYPGISEEKKSLVINGIDDLTQYEYQEVCKIKSQQYEKKYRFCCTGTINQRKGQYLIVEALHQLDKKKLDQLSVSFIGNGPDRTKLESLCEKYNLSDVVRFEGSVPNAEVYRYLAQNNIFILMSFNEGLPISIIEAMRIGMPVISTNVSGIPETIDNNKTGVLIEPSVDELLCVLNNIQNYEWFDMGKNAKQKYEREFTFERMRSDYVRMIHKTIKK